MNVLFDIDIFAMQRFGGISRYYVELARAINKQPDQSLNVRIMGGFHRNAYLNTPDMRLCTGSIFLPNFRGAGLILSKVNKLCKKLTSFNEVDIYHSTYYNIPRNIPKSIFKVLTVYDMIHEIYPNYFPKNDKTREIKAKAILEADHIFAISENTKNDLIKFHGLEEKNISVVYLGVDHLAKKKEKAKSNDPFLLYVGPRSGYKNFRNLLSAYVELLAAFPNLKLIAFGGGFFTAKEKILFKNLGLNENQCFQLVGSDELLNDLYQKASVFVYPSLYEGFGIPPLEAMFQGCAVAASNTSSISEILGNAAELFDPMDVGDIKKKIKYILDDEVRMQNLIAKGLDKASLYTWEKCAQKTVNAYKNLIK